jgi:membrane protein involved in colicin uptake
LTTLVRLYILVLFDADESKSKSDSAATRLSKDEPEQRRLAEEQQARINAEKLRREDEARRQRAEAEQKAREDAAIREQKTSEAMARMLAGREERREAEIVARRRAARQKAQVQPTEKAEEDPTINQADAPQVGSEHRGVQVGLGEILHQRS